MEQQPLPAPPIPPASPRTPLHTRQLRFEGFHRDDGLWDIEATLTDTKAYAAWSADKGELPPGTPVHDMWLRVTLDDELKVRAIETVMPSTPFGECQQARDPMQKLVGETIGPGWRLKIDRAIGGVGGCTHLRELLFNVATAAYQTIPGYRSHLRRKAGEPAHGAGSDGKPPFFLGQCIGWDADGPVVARHYPQFIGWRPPHRPKPAKG